MRYLIPLLFCLGSYSLFAQFREASTTLYFDKNEYELSIENQKKLSEYIDGIRREKIVLLSVFGHTDDVNSKSFNEKLSLQRAQTVLDFLRKGGLEADEIQILHESYEKPLVPNDSEEHKAQNRRVEITAKVQIPPPPLPPPPIIEEEILLPNTVTRIEANQLFDCKNKGLPDTLIVYTAKGTELKLSTEDFKECCQTGGELKVDIVEACNPQEVAASGWTTRSNGQILASGGMLSIKITCGNEPLEYKGCFTLEFPIQEREGLDLYISNDKGNPNWQLTNKGNMVFDSIKKCYLINYCGGIGLGGILINGDVQMPPPMLVRVKRHRGKNPSTALLLEDGMITVAYNPWPEDKSIPRRFNLISMIPSKASGTGQYTIEKTGKVYETNSVVQMSPKKATREIYLKDKGENKKKKKTKYILLRRTKIKYKRCKFSCY